MSFDIMGRASQEKVDAFCREVREMGLMIEDRSQNGTVILKIGPINDSNRVPFRQLYYRYFGAIGGLFLTEVSDAPIREEPPLMVTT